MQDDVQVREDVTQAAGHDDFAVYVEEAEAKRILAERHRAS